MLLGKLFCHFIKSNKKKPGFLKKMVLTSNSPVLSWSEIKKNLNVLKFKSLSELIKVYHKHENITCDAFKWGDESELTLVKFDHANRKCYLLLKAEAFFEHITRTTEATTSEFHFNNEFTDYIIETIPGKPFESIDFEDLNQIEHNFQMRKKFIQTFLGKDEYVVSLTCFPLLGCPNFTWPAHNITESNHKETSLFFSNNIIMNQGLFRAATRNKIERKNLSPAIYVPIYSDINTPKPFIENLNTAIKPDHIYMDHDGFGMGCCCIQVTFQAESLDQCCWLYDQLTVIAPIILALSASSPIWRGYLADIDCRWSVLKQAFDDRTSEELNGDSILNSSRFDDIDVYLSPLSERYNDFKFNKDNATYEILVEEKIKASIANHFANMYTRDPFVVLEDHLMNEDDEFTGNFDMFNCTNWRLLRFKPPPLKCDPSNPIGWRCEFRPTEIQFTDFENSAFATLIVLLSRAIISLNLNFLVDITKVKANMERAQCRNACLNEKFYFRTNLTSVEEECALVEMDINEIMNGSKRFRGLIPILCDYLKTTNMSNETKANVMRYLELFKRRASGQLMTPASWIRGFVKNHKSYQNDSKINEDINYDLMWSIYEISIGKGEKYNYDF